MADGARVVMCPITAQEYPLDKCNNSAVIEVQWLGLFILAFTSLKVVEPGDAETTGSMGEEWHAT